MGVACISPVLKLLAILSLFEGVISDNIESNYIGCYIDAAPAQRLFKNHEEIIKNNSPKACIKVCESKGYAYAGMQYGKECFCGNEKPKTKTRADESECSTDCPGNKEFKCGAGWRTSAYKTGLKDSTTKEQLKYIGCYADYGSLTHRLFDKYQSDFREGQTPHYCVGLCYSLGYSYAALQYNFQCFCGKDHPPVDRLRQESECELKCSGDPTEKCGGHWKLSVYSTSITDIPALGRYIGCYIDSEDRRVLNGIKRDFSTTNTPHLCVNFCLSNNFNYAGLQYGRECFCGNDDISADTSPDSQCQLDCPGDDTRTCGGHWRLAVYQLDVDTSFRAPQYLGCFKDESNDTRLFQGYKENFHSSLTVQKCIDLCRSKGFHYSGLQYKYECFCNDKKPSASLLVGELDCQYPCTGDHSQKCGGDWRYSVYWNGLKNPLRSSENYLGCFKERNAPQQLLPLDSITFEKSLTPQLCIEHCFRKGYPYSGTQISSVRLGTQSKSQCHCGDYRPSTEHQTAESQCSSVCPADQNKKCGGDWRLSVYRTGVHRYNQTYAENKYLGCFKYDKRTLLQYKVELSNNSPQRCMGICKGVGYPFAGLKNENECYCGKRAPPSSSGVAEDNCSIFCRGSNTVLCGGNNAWSIYSVPLTHSDENVVNRDGGNDEGAGHCYKSKTEIIGKRVCKGSTIFEETFDKLDLYVWQRSVRMSIYPENYFAYFTSDWKNSFIRNGILHLHPIVLPEENVISGRRHLTGCTGRLGTMECEREAFSFHILPPIASAEISTKKTFSFQYGIVEIRAKLPAGDWIIPEIWLEPKNEVYGAGLLSGKIKIAFAPGNTDLISSDGRDIGIKCLDSGVTVGHDDLITGRNSTVNKPEGWNTNYHNFTLIWAPDSISLIVDDEPQTTIIPQTKERLCSLVGLHEKCETWARGTHMAPFDKEFYLTLGLTAGGMQEFPNGCKSRGFEKPWKNHEVKAMLKFWEDRSRWYSTWKSDEADLKIDYIRVRAL